MISIIYGSSREGNTESLGQILLEGKSYNSYKLRDFNIGHISDLRHDASGFSRMNDDYYDIIDQMIMSETIIFATPLYWYGMSDVLKTFISRFSESMRDDDLNFKEKMRGKNVYLLIVGGDNPRIKGLPLVQQFQYICDFLELNFIDYIIGQGNKPSEVLSDQQALDKARLLNETI